MGTIVPPPPPRLDELRFHFQPVFALASGAAGWSEALVRWHLPDGTVLGPAEVLPHWLAAARQPTFTRYTLEQAAAALALRPAGHVSVNLSPAQAILPATIQTLEALLPAVRSRLRIEITEQRVRDVPGLASALAAVRRCCGGVLLDDVTPDDLDLRSHANASVDGIKLDRSVVASLASVDAGSVARRFVASVSQRFPIVVAEGVEDPHVCEALAELGVSHAQGFGLARPRRDFGEAHLECRAAVLAPVLPPIAPAAKRCSIESDYPTARGGLTDDERSS
jgi:EAL domain-containing protein (putative c-di-GMP-specific phosphodiesterase class I)